VLVFTRTKHGANRLAQQLTKQDIQADAIHGNKSQPQRTRALAGFKAGTVRVLVATDIAARGLDIELLPHVVNFDLPNVPEDYVHRIGRTGRAGSTGEAISLVCAEEYPLLADIEKVLKRKLDRQVVAGFEPGTGTANDPTDVRPPRQASGPKRNAGTSNRQKSSAGTAAPRGGRGTDRPRNARPETRGAAQPPAPERANAVPRRAPEGERQPVSNASSQFPSSGPARGAARPGVAQLPRRDDARPVQGSGAKRDGRPVAALLGGPPPRRAT
jgi:ATP-dependent RNA helicase RhlE